nr:immunoglobulin light chain junction region [Macaca mulatta]
CVQGIAFPLTF